MNILKSFNPVFISAPLQLFREKRKGYLVVYVLLFSSLACHSSSTPPLSIQTKPGLPMVKPDILLQSFPESPTENQKRMVVSLSKSSQIALDVPPNKLPGMVALRITGPVTRFHIQNEGEPRVGDLEGLITSLTQGLRSDRQKAEALFGFVVHQMKDWYYPAQGIDLTVEDLNALIWNFGFGFCYDLGRLQAGLWAKAGLRSRIVGWPQHTVAEVFYNGAWHLYDLQHRNFYEKDDGTVASFAELKANPDLFYQNLNEYGLDPIGYPPHHLAHWYGIANPDFQESKVKDYWKVERDFRLTLRIGEYFEILYNDPAVIYHPSSWHQYYGEMTTKKDPPWPLNGRLIFAPHFSRQVDVWKPATTPEGKPGLSLEMNCPYFFTQGWIHIPEIKGFCRIWVEAFGQTLFAGRLVGGNSVFSKFIEGSNSFRIILDAQEMAGNEESLGNVEIHTRLQLSPLGLPKLKPGKNLLPVVFEAGSPEFSVWYCENIPDLEITGFKSSPENPLPGTLTQLIYTITNKGTGPSQATSLTVNNNVTAFMAETLARVGVMTIPPLKAGETAQVEFTWESNTRMTWYGKNPHVQLFDAWIDIEKNQLDFNRENNRRQDYILLKKEDGNLPELPGYASLPELH